jgi:dihydrofolate synthase/folylpolyglutamate synthase
MNPLQVDTYADAVRFLFSLQKFGMKFGLGGIRSLLRFVDDPQKDFPCIHVAGTNGKGSTSSMLAAIFTAAGYKTGLYTSPHLVSFTERIRVDGKPIPRKDVVRLTGLIRGQIRKQKATFFEATTAMAFKYFSERNVDLAIVETGLGGRLDSTNVVHPRLSVITNVSLEHTEILGDTLEKIAGEKGGIIKHGIPCVTGIQSPGPLRVLRDIAKRKKSPLYKTDPSKLRIKKASLDGLILDAAVRRKNYKDLHVALAGRHQLMNLGVVLLALDVLEEQREFKVKEEHIRRGLSDVQTLTGLRARMSVIQRKPFILADVAHNTDGVKRMVESLVELGIKRVTLVFGVVRDKDYESMIQELSRVARNAVVTTAKTERARSLSDLVVECSRQGIEVLKAESSVRKAVESALSFVQRRTPILITGSHYVVGEALSYLRSRKMT